MYKELRIPAAEQSTTPLESRASTHTTPDRLEQVVTSLLPAGGSALLLGEAGSGKNRLAEEAAYALDHRIEGGVSVILLPTPAIGADETDPLAEETFLAFFGVAWPAHGPPGSGLAATQLAQCVLQKILDHAEGRAPVVVVPSIDVYPPNMALLLAAIARSADVRFIATARRLSGAAELVARAPHVERLSVGPLSYDEAKQLLTRLLRCEEVEFSTLHRWYGITSGFAHTLTTLVLALDRRGLIERDKGMVWEKNHSVETIPEEFILYLEDTCSDEELHTLETIVLAEPLTESILIEQLSPEPLQTLQAKGLVVQRVLSGGEIALLASHDLLTRAVKNRMGPARRMKLSQDIYRTLRHELEGHPDRVIRLVRLGIEAHRILPIELLVTALDHPSFDRDPESKLRLSLAIAHHPDAFGSRLAEAAMSLARTARMLGEQDMILEGMSIVKELIARQDSLHACAPSQRIRLQLELATHYTLDLDQPEVADELLSRLAKEIPDTSSSAAEMVRCARALLYARTGRLKESVMIGPTMHEEGRMQIEWIRSQSRLVSSLILTQQGRFGEAISGAERARTFAVLGNRAERFIADELSLAVFFGQWAQGSLVAAHETMQHVQHQSLSRLHETGFVETGLAALALSEGRWREAAQRAARAADRGAKRDPFGMTGLINGVLAYALAALGERVESRQAMVRAEVSRPGTSQALQGIVRVLLLEAKLWNEDADLIPLTHKTCAWASAESLSFVELRAMQVLASVQGSLDVGHMSRARKLATLVEAPMGNALLGFIEEVCAGESKWDSPSARILSDLGIWVPLPRTPLLSAREREIALHAALGYSSRWIASRFFLSTRTVETHLRHIFTKLGVTGRDELRNFLHDGEFSA